MQTQALKQAQPLPAGSLPMQHEHDTVNPAPVVDLPLQHEHDMANTAPVAALRLAARSEAESP